MIRSLLVTSILVIPRTNGSQKRTIATIKKIPKYDNERRLQNPPILQRFIIRSSSSNNVGNKKYMKKSDSTSSSSSLVSSYCRKQDVSKLSFVIGYPIVRTDSIKTKSYIPKTQQQQQHHNFNTINIIPTAYHPTYQQRDTFFFRQQSLLPNQHSLVRSNSITTTSSTRLFSSVIIPRAAVSNVIRCRIVIGTHTSNKQQQQQQPPNVESDNTTNNNNNYYYLLVQRGNEPNKGIWSFPGGKINAGETTIHGAQRELKEEVQVQIYNRTSNTNIVTDWNSIVQWYPEPILTSDSIGDGYHYLIAQCYGEFQIIINSTAPTTTTYTNEEQLPTVLPMDDAADAKWFTISEIQRMEYTEKLVTPGSIRVINRIEQLSNAGLLL